jgi:predicted outer membrane repeat protein
MKNINRPIKTRTSKAKSSAFVKPSIKRGIAVLGTSGLVFGFGVVANSPAMATGEIECNPGNTIYAVSDPGANHDSIQSNLSADGVEQTVCLSGDFLIDEHIIFEGTKRIKGIGDSSLEPTIESGVFSSDPFYPTNIIYLENLTIKNAHQAVVSSDTYAKNIKFEGNTYGAILGYNAYVLDSTFIDNDNGISYGGDGGAIYSVFVAEVSTSTFVGNTAQYGGAIYAETVSVSNSTFLSNEARGGGSEGGAIYATDGSVYFSTFVNNLAAAPVAEQDTPGNAIYKTGMSQFSLGANIFAGTSTYPQLGYGVPGTDEFTDNGGNVFSTSAATETDIIQDASSVFGASLTSLFGTATPSVATYAPDTFGTQTIALVAGSPAIDIVPFDVTDNVGPYFDQRGVARSHPADAGAFELVATAGRLADTGNENVSWIGASSAGLIALGGLAMAYKSRFRRRSI